MLIYVGRLRYKTSNAVVTTTIRPPFASRSTAVRPRYDHSTNHVTTGLLHALLSK